MAYFTQPELAEMGFRSLGKGVQVSTKATLYFPSSISIGDYSRIDDFCTLSGEISIGRNVHVAVHSNIAGGTCGVEIGDFAGLAYGCHLIAQSDDYSGRTMTNPTIPPRFKQEFCERVMIGSHVILGTGTIVLPGVNIPEGVSSGAQTLFTKSVESWGLYVGSPARRVKERSRDLLALTEEFLSTEK